ncbi:MAG: MerR family transcriptional regulator [Chloroflexota bacterium]
MDKLKIGDFAKLAQIPTHRLRYYDKQGLLSPITTDDETGYRYYSIEQLGQLNRIISLLDMGLSVAEIKANLIANIDVEQMEELLYRRQIAIEKEIISRQFQLRQVHHRLQQIEEQSQESPYDIVVKSLHAYSVASIRETINSFQDIALQCSDLHEEIYETISQCGVNAESPTINLYHMPAFKNTDLDFEACVVVPYKVLAENPNSRVKFRKLNKYPKAATLLFTGDCNYVSSAVRYIEKWAAREGYRPAGAVREVHYSDVINAVKGQAGEPVFEIQVPIK